MAAGEAADIAPVLPRRGRKGKPQALLDLSPAVHSCILGGSSPLVSAMYRNRVDAVRELLALGASLQPDWGTHRRCSVQTLINEALAHGHAGVAQVLVDAMKVGAWAGVVWGQPVAGC